jgi:predicted nucleic acid-binding protein
MTRLIVYSWAWIEYLDGSKAGREVDSRISGAEELRTSVFSVAEIVSKYGRLGRPEGVAVEAVGALSRTGVPSMADAVDAGKIHSEVRPASPGFGLADSFVLQLARKVGGKVLTGNPDFRGLRDAVVIE